MAKQLFANNASSLLAASIDDNDLTIQVQSGQGAYYPNPGADEFFIVTLENALGDIEHIKIASRAADLLTVAAGGRGQEGSSAQSWTNGQARVELRPTRGTMEVFLQRGGDAMSGDLDMNGNDIEDAHLTGAATKILAGEIVGVPMRGAIGDASNELAVPNNGSRATAGGAPLLTQADEIAALLPAGMITMWYGAADAVPNGWALCDGNNGTPNMLDRLPIGAGSTYAKGAQGGSATASGTTDVSGEHNHAVAVDNHVLTVDEIPAHRHGLYVCINGSGTTHNFDGDSGIAGDTDPKAYYDRNQGNTGAQLMGATGGGAGHGHTGTASPAGAHAHTVSGIATLPPYRALYFIMKL